MQHPELGECSSVLCPLLPSWSHQGHGFREEEDKDKVPMFSLKIISVCHPWLPLPVLTLVGGRDAVPQVLCCSYLEEGSHHIASVGARQLHQGLCSGVLSSSLLSSSPSHPGGWQCTPDWPEVYSPPPSATQVLGFWVHTSMLGFHQIFTSTAAAVFAPMRLTMTTAASGCRRLIHLPEESLLGYFLCAEIMMKSNIHI